MSILEVPGARLYYETCGSGPLIVMVPGATGAADSFSMVTKHLSARYTVVTYDRRGFSRSQLNGSQDYAHRLDTDADDVRRLIEYVGDEPAIVFGGSSGGIIVLEVLTHHPSLVHTAVPFEPPAMRQLADGQKWLEFFVGLYDIYRQSGIDLALDKFREQTFAESDPLVMDHAKNHKNDEFRLANATYWFEHELRQYPAVEIDLDVLKVHANQLLLLNGRESRGYPAYEVNVELGKKLGRDTIEMPGGHVGYVAQSAEFAREFVQALEQTDHERKA